MLETAISHYHALLDADIARATAEELTRAQRERNLFFGERPLVSVLRPRLITPAQYELLRRACGLVGAAMQRLGDEMLADPQLRAGVALTAQEEALVQVDPGYAGHCAHSRMDTFLTLDGASLRFVEYNGESPAAIAYEDVLSEVFLNLPAMHAFAQHYDVRPLPARQRLLDALLDAWRQFGGTNAPTVAILDWHGLPTRSEFLLFQQFFHEHGIAAAICSPDDLVYRDGTLFATSYETIDQHQGDFPITLVYKRVLSSELLTRYGDAALDHPLLHAYRDGSVCVVNSLRAKLLHKKAIFDLLTSERTQHLFTDDQRAAIAAHVPWTRLFREGLTTYQGEHVDLPVFARHNRDRLVLKPNDEYGGKGVIIGWETSADAWDRALAAALTTPTIVQERVEIAYEDYPALANGVLQIGRRLVDTDPFMFGSDVHGTLCRLSTVTLLNVTAGGGSTTPVFVVEPRAAAL
jgi:uncharacterized circularly permuted ATP-grasp superfamily protein